MVAIPGAFLMTILAVHPAALAREVSKDRLEADVKKLAGFNTRNSFSEVHRGRGPGRFRGLGGAMHFVDERFGDIATRSPRMISGIQEFDARDRRTGATKALRNFYLEIEGTESPKEVIVFGAHYDSINSRDRDVEARAPGANDNASGTASVLEAARIFAAHPWKRTLIFAAFSGEEQGLHGSKAFSEMLERNGYKVVAMLNNDIVGGARKAKGGPNKDVIRCFSEPRHLPSRRFARYLAHIAERDIPDLRVRVEATRDRPGRGGDHQSFSARRMPAARLIELHEDLTRQHNAKDLPEFIDFNYHVRSTALDVAAIASLANAPAAPKAPRCRLEGGKVIIEWDPVAGARGYQVELRARGRRLGALFSAKGTRFEVEARAGSVSILAEGAEGARSLLGPETAIPEAKRKKRFF